MDTLTIACFISLIIILHHPSFNNKDESITLISIYILFSLCIMMEFWNNTL